MVWTTWIGAGIWFVVCSAGGLVLGRALWAREWRQIVRQRGLVGRRSSGLDPEVDPSRPDGPQNSRRRQ